MYLFKIKCMNCSLHFTVTSWHENWPKYDLERTENTGAPICPECGDTGFDRKLVAVEKRESEQIFEHVPGTTQWTSLGVAP